MSETVQANNGTPLPLSSLPTEIVYVGSFVTEIIVEYAGETYKQTFTNNGTEITGISRWEVQP